MKSGSSIELKATRSVRGIQKVSWNELYDSVQEMIDDLCSINYSNCSAFTSLRGYKYLEGFKRYYLLHGYLTDKQTVQLKRLASSLYYFLYVVNK